MGANNRWYWRPKDPDPSRPYKPRAACDGRGGYWPLKDPDPRPCDKVEVNSTWTWAIDQVCFDKRYKSFFAMYMDHPPVYISPEFAVDAIWSWFDLSALDYAAWLAWRKCAAWDDVVLALDAAAKSSPSPSIWPPRNGWDPYGGCRTTMDGPDSIPPPPLPDMTPERGKRLERIADPRQCRTRRAQGRGMLASIAGALRLS